MLLKVLLVVGVIAVIYFLFVKKPAVASKPKRGDAAPDDDTMVPCETCGVFVSVKEAFMRDGKYFCSKQCMEAK